MYNLKDKTINPLTLEGIALDKYFPKSVLAEPTRLYNCYSVFSRLKTDNPFLYAAYKGLGYGVVTARYDGLVVAYFFSLTIRDFFKLVVLPLARDCAKQGIETEGEAYEFTKGKLVAKWIALGKQVYNR